MASLDCQAFSPSAGMARKAGRRVSRSGFFCGQSGSARVTTAAIGAKSQCSSVWRSAAIWAYLLGAQEKDGSWYGRWGVNYIYGSFLAMRGLAASQAPGSGDALGRAAKWLRAIQNPDGGWGESGASYTRDCYVPAPSSASQ